MPAKRQAAIVVVPTAIAAAPPKAEVMSRGFKELVPFFPLPFFSFYFFESQTLKSRTFKTGKIRKPLCIPSESLRKAMRRPSVYTIDSFSAQILSITTRQNNPQNNQEAANPGKGGDSDFPEL